MNFLNQVEKKLLQDKLSDNKRNISIFVLMVVILTLTVILILFISNRNASKQDSTLEIVETEVQQPIVYSSEGLSTDREPTTLEKLGLKDKMFVAEKGETICSNCARPLEIYDDYFTIVLTESDSFLKLYLCDNCFAPMGDLLKTIGI